jgi:hypothetical protein
VGSIDFVNGSASGVFPYLVHFANPFSTVTTGSPLCQPFGSGATISNLTTSSFQISGSASDNETLSWMCF